MLPQHMDWRTVIVSAPEQIHKTLNKLSYEGYMLHSVVAGTRLWGDDSSSRTVPCWVIVGYKAAATTRPHQTLAPHTYGLEKDGL